MKITHDQIQAAYDTAKKRGKITDTTTVAQQVLDVVGECVEFVEAWRKDRKIGFCLYEKLISFSNTGFGKDALKIYSLVCKNTVEDELADIWIALLTLMKLTRVDAIQSIVHTQQVKFHNVEELVKRIMITVLRVGELEPMKQLSVAFDTVGILSAHLNIDMELHVRAKMAYNAARED